jgi:hypothetical protein
LFGSWLELLIIFNEVLEGSVNAAWSGASMILVQDCLFRKLDISVVLAVGKCLGH